MFDLYTTATGKNILVYKKRSRYEGERGHWIEIGHESFKNINFFVEYNRANGLQVEKDEHGTYRALVLKD